MLPEKQVRYAIRMKRTGKTEEQIVAEFGGAFTIAQIYQSMREYRTKERLRHAHRKSVCAIDGSRISIQPEIVRVPMDVRAEHDLRSTLVPASVTAAVFGDPLPGYSALDRKRQTA